MTEMFHFMWWHLRQREVLRKQASELRVHTANSTVYNRHLYTVTKLILLFDGHYHRKCANWLTMLQKKLINSMEQGPSSEANSFSAILQISRILLIPKGSYQSSQQPLLVTVLSQLSLRSTLTLPYRPPLGLPSSLFPSGSPSKPYVHFSSPHEPAVA